MPYHAFLALRTPLGYGCLGWLLVWTICQAQSPTIIMNNPLLCDPNEGICAVPLRQDHDTTSEKSSATTAKALQIVYFTDPICSSCWGIEPQLRRLKLAYGDIIDISYQMGGLLPDWSYNSGGISQPSDVAHHWDEVSHHYDMPIDGDVWIEDPLHSSYPPSIAFKAAQLQAPNKALQFLRLLREMVFLQKKNITRWEYINAAAIEADLDPTLLQQHYQNEAKTLLEEDLALARQLGVRGFPTLLLRNAEQETVKIYGFKPYSVFENAIQTLYPSAKPTNYDTAWAALFDHYPTLTTREFAELSQLPRPAAESLLQILSVQGQLHALTTKNGTLWIRK
ncbi:MAG: DsbA family protein [Chitinophagales bacterium]|nr:DsbA family protein [Chitinophagales bacterium]